MCVYEINSCANMNILHGSIPVYVPMFNVYLSVCVSLVYSYAQSQSSANFLLFNYLKLFSKLCFYKLSQLKLHIFTENDCRKGLSRSTREKGDWAVTDAQIRTLISHAKSPGTGPQILDVPL